MKKAMFLLGCLLIWASPGIAAQAGPADKSLSPYFFVEGEASGTERFPLKDTRVEVGISGVIAHVTVTQTYANMGDKAICGRYIFPGSTRAAVHAMKMTIGERVTHAVIKEKEEARKVYDQAKAEGKNAALLEQKRPNVFSMQVANIMPGDTLEVELRYTEMLVPENGTYSFVYPAVVGPRYSTIPDDAEHTNEKWIQNPYLKQGREPDTGFDITLALDAGMNIQEASCTTHDTAIRYENASRARIVLAHPEIFSGDRDYIVQYRLMDRAITSGLLLEKDGEEQFFLLMAQPPERVTADMLPRREYTFVVDVSGSMQGFPLDTAKKLVKDLIGNLKPTDSFNVVLFSGGSNVMSPAPVPAVKENIRAALALIDNCEGGGGTELLKALKRVMELEREAGVSRTIVVVTDGYIGGEKEVFAEIDNNLDTTNVFAFGIGSSVNRYLIEGIARAGRGEPFVVTAPEQTGAVADRFRRYISSPVLTDIKLRAEGVELYDVEPPAIADLFAERPIVVFGKWRGEKKGTLTLSGENGEGGYSKTFALEEAVLSEQSKHLAYLWARTKIARIEDYAPSENKEAARQQVVGLGLAYNLLTPYTSFVAVDEVVRNQGAPGEDVDQPLPLPKGVSNMAVGGGMQKVPEPGMTTLALLLMGAFLLAHGRRQTDRFYR